MERNESMKSRKGDRTIKGVSAKIDKSDWLLLKTLLLEKGITLNQAITIMIKNYITKGGKLE